MFVVLYFKDSFWCKIQKELGTHISINEKLYVYHDNQFDNVPDPAAMRKTIVEEILGGALCRGSKYRENYMAGRIVELRAWHIRIKGILIALRKRPYVTDEMVRSFIAPLENIFDDKKWEDEVFAVVEREFVANRNFHPSPVHFSKDGNHIIQIDEMTKKELVQEYERSRIDVAGDLLFKAIGAGGKFVGLGNEGVSFVVGKLLYKVFDRVHGFSHEAAEKVEASVLEHDGSTLILQRRFYDGKLYRGGHGQAVVNMLRGMRIKRLYHSNISPDNLVFDDTGTLHIVDIGRDLHYEEDMSVYEAHFKDMVKRSFLCMKYGNYASNSFTNEKLKSICRHPSPLQLVGLDHIIAAATNDANSTPEHVLLQKLYKTDALCCGILSHSSSSRLPFKVISTNKDDGSVIIEIEAALSAKLTECRSQPIALVLEDPYSNVQQSMRRPVWFYERHIRRFLQNKPYTMVQQPITSIDNETFQEETKYHIFLLSPSDPGCYLLIKSCPMEHSFILPNVRRIVHSLERAMSFKSIILIADISKTDNFLRQYESRDIGSYQRALRQIQEERLIDKLLIFDGEETSEVIKLNKNWFGCKSKATHSSEGQHYASTLYALQNVKDHADYKYNDLVLQLDSDIVMHCEEGNDGLSRCAAEFRKEPDLVTFAFPILGSNDAVLNGQYTSQNGIPLRMEIRCSFVHLNRLFGMLPLTVPPHEGSLEAGGTLILRRGWWHVLDHNIMTQRKKSFRCSLAGTRLFFIHPQNDMKKSKSLLDLHLASDTISSNFLCLSGKAAFNDQIGKVDLQTTDWLPKRDDSTVVVFHLQNTAERDGKLDNMKTPVLNHLHLLINCNHCLLKYSDAIFSNILGTEAGQSRL